MAARRQSQHIQGYFVLFWLVAQHSLETAREYRSSQEKQPLRI